MAAADDQVTYAVPSLLELAYYACDRDQRTFYDELPVPSVDLQACCDSILKIIKLNSSADHFQPSGNLRSMFTKGHIVYRMNNNILETAATFGHINCMKLGRAMGVPWFTPNTWVKSACDEAASTGNMECLVYAHTNGSLWSTATCALAVESGHLDCLKYLHENGCPWDEWTCTNSAGNGHIECLVYARQHGCPWEVGSPSMAAMNGHLDCLVYCHENGCPWDTFTCEMAAYKGRLECLKYARTNGCPWNDRTCIMAASKGHVECLRYAIENGCEWDVKGYLMGVNEDDDPSCVKYALQLMYGPTAASSSTDDDE